MRNFLIGTSSPSTICQVPKTTIYHPLRPTARNSRGPARLPSDGPALNSSALTCCRPRMLVRVTSYGEMRSWHMESDRLISKDRVSKLGRNLCRRYKKCVVLVMFFIIVCRFLAVDNCMLNLICLSWKVYQIRKTLLSVIIGTPKIYTGYS